MAINVANIPPNAAHILFAEDLMQWLLQRQAGIHYEAEIAGPYRNFIFNAFNDDVKIAVDFIDMTLEEEVEENFSALVDVNVKSFLDYALHYEEIYFKNGFVADCFLEYCVRLVSMAVNFVLFDVPEALNISLRIILELLEGNSMFTEGWDTLIAVAKKYSKIYQDCRNVITPETSDDEFPAQNSDEEVPAQNSDDAPPVYSSKEESPLYSSEEESPLYSSEEESPLYSSDDELQTISSDNSLDDGNEVSDTISNRGHLQKPERVFETNNLSRAKEGLQPERPPKQAINADLDSGKKLEGTSSTYNLSNAPEKSDELSTSNAESDLTAEKLIATNEKIPRETINEEH